MIGLTGIETFDARVIAEQRVTGFSQCFLWQGPCAKRYGHGVVGYQGRQWKAHRLAYTLVIGEIPAGLVLDHLCRVTNCVNPEHLEPVTNVENVMRGVSAPARFARATHCKRGHEFTPDNTHKNGKNGRGCIACRREAGAARLAVIRAARQPRVSTRGQNVTHGTGSTYRSYGCRCDPCCAAGREDNRRGQEKRMAKKRAAKETAS